MKRLFAFVLAICMLTTAFAGCGQQANTPTEPKADQASTNEVEKKDEKPAKDVDLTFFTGKVETVDLLDEIIADFNAQRPLMSRNMWIRVSIWICPIWMRSGTD